MSRCEVSLFAHDRSVRGDEEHRALGCVTEYGTEVAQRQTRIARSVGSNLMGEYEVAALNRQQVVAGVVGAAAILGLCSCSPTPSPDPTGSVGPTIEQTIEPTAESTVAPSPEAGAQDWVATDNYLAVPAGITFPSQTDPN